MTIAPASRRPRSAAARRHAATGIAGLRHIRVRTRTSPARAAVDAALEVLDGAPDAPLSRMSKVAASDRDLATIVEGSLEHERQIERRETDWLNRARR